MAELTPAATLRAAATLIRETASNATPGPWSLISYQIAGVYDEAADSVTNVAFTNGNTPNARWIALMSPAVAEHLAAWLEDEAEGMTIFDPAEHEHIFSHPLAVARSILGRQS